jgi:hypothetical protein
MAVASALYTLIQIGAFQKLPSDGLVSAQKLAIDVNVDLSVITRTMRVVVANGIAIETAPDEYAHNMSLHGVATASTRRILFGLYVFPEIMDQTARVPQISHSD